MKQTAIMLAGLVLLLTLGVTAQENRSEISLQGTGFFTRDTSGQGISRTTSDTGGFLVGYRYHINRWFAAEANYGSLAIPRGILPQADFRESSLTFTQPLRISLLIFRSQKPGSVPTSSAEAAV
jgi:hypothetical protein